MRISAMNPDIAKVPDLYYVFFIFAEYSFSRVALSLSLARSLSLALSL